MSGQYSGSYTKSVDITVTSATLEPGFSMAGGVSIAVYSTLGTNSFVNFATIDGGATLDSFGVILEGSIVSVTNESTGTIKVDSYGLGVRYATGTIVNAGTIEAVLNKPFSVPGVGPIYGALGISLDQSNVQLTNLSGGLIQGALGGIEGIGGSGTITNDGIIRGGYGTIATPNGVIAYHDEFGVVSQYGGVTNESGGTIGGFLGVSGRHLSILNDGLITGSHWGVYDLYATISNLDSAGSVATISGGAAGIQARIGDTIINDGVVLGTAGAGIVLDSFKNLYITAKPSLDNQAGGTIEGTTAGLYVKSIHDPTLTNAGLIQGNDNSEGVKLLFPVDLQNTGTITGASGVLDVGYGVYYNTIASYGASVAATVESLASVPSTLVNKGTIDAVLNAPASGSYGVLLRGAASVSNFGLIEGGARGIAIEATRSISAPGYVFNAGTITGAGVAGVVLNTGGTLVNGGTITGGYYAAVVFNNPTVADRLVLDIGARINGRVLAHGTVGNVLELTDTFVFGYGGPGGNTTVYGLGNGINGFNTIQVDNAAHWTLAAGAGNSFTGGVSLGTSASLTNDIAISGSVTGIGSDIVQNANQIIASTAAAYAVVLDNSGEVFNSGTIAGGQRAVGINGTYGLIDNSGTIEGGNVVGIQLSAGGTVQNSGSIGAGYYAAIVFNATAAADRLIVDPGARFGGRVLAHGSLATLEFAAGSGNLSGIGSNFQGFDILQFDSGAAWTAAGTINAFASQTIAGFGKGDTIILDGFAATPNNDDFIPGVGLVVANSTASTLLNLDTTSSYDTGNFTITGNSVADTTTISVVPCFCAGTRILLRRGEIPVDDVREGDIVILANGNFAPITWIGHRTLDCTRHPSPEQILPVLIEASAIATGIPCRDLYLSPDHALLLGNRLIPAKTLINGHTIRQVNRRSITYYHIELATHAALLAEATPAESYLDTGNRGAFVNAGTPTLLHPDLAQTLREAESFAPFADSGPVVETVRRRILARANIATTTDPDLTISYLKDGAAIIKSRSGIPGHLSPDPRDRRILGVKIAELSIGGAKIPLDHPALTTGWHATEPDGRWTNGSAIIPASLANGQPVTLALAAAATYPLAAPAHRQRYGCQ